MGGEGVLSFSDYIIYADESGDHGLTSIDPEFPVFALIFCIFEKTHYRNVLEPAARALKHKWFGHDCVIFHEREIRKQLPPFSFLMGEKGAREEFMADLTALIGLAEFAWIASIIDKNALRAKYANPWNPYEVAMHVGMERIWKFLRDKDQEDKTVHVLFEARGKQEDRNLELEFRRVVSNEARWGWRAHDFTQFRFEPVFVPKAANCAGHQITDMIARPLALRALRPEQPNRAANAIWDRIFSFKVFP